MKKNKRHSKNTKNLIFIKLEILNLFTEFLSESGIRFKLFNLGLKFRSFQILDLNLNLQSLD